MAAHSSHGMSGQSRIIACPGSIGMSEGTPNDSNPAAELGTAVHEVGEFALQLGVPAKELVGISFNDHKCTDEMAEGAQVYCDAVNAIRTIPGVQLILEGKVCISSIDPERLWGTGDCLVIDRGSRILYVGDYKNGYGIVEVDGIQEVYNSCEIQGNAQCVGYGLGALDTHNLWEHIDHVVTFIVQPNIDHVDGSVRHQTYDMEDMRKWHEVYAYTHALSLQPNAPRNPGKHCKYCKAKGFCSARMTHQMRLLGLDGSLYKCTDEQLLAIYKDSSVMIKTIEAVRQQVIIRARRGMRIPGEKLVNGIARGKCADPDALIADAIELGHTKLELHNLKLKGKTEIKKVIGKALADKHFVVPDAGLTLVPMSNPRSAVMADGKPSATGVFQPIK